MLHFTHSSVTKLHLSLCNSRKCPGSWSCLFLFVLEQVTQTSLLDYCYGVVWVFSPLQKEIPELVSLLWAKHCLTVKSSLKPLLYFAYNWKKWKETRLLCEAKILSCCFIPECLQQQTFYEEFGYNLIYRYIVWKLYDCRQSKRVLHIWKPKRKLSITFFLVSGFISGCLVFLLINRAPGSCSVLTCIVCLTKKIVSWKSQHRKFGPKQSFNKEMIPFCLPWDSKRTTI